MTIHGALTGLGAWTGIAIIFATWWGIAGYRAKSRRRKQR